jgi:hypothetical protein
MNRIAPALVALVALTGCPPTDNYNFQGLNMVDYFPMDGNRFWQYAKRNHDLPYHLFSELDPAYETTADNKRIYKLDYWNRCISGSEGCEDAWVRSVKMSIDRTVGAQLHAWSHEADVWETFNPPIRIALPTMYIGESDTRTVDGDVAGMEWTTVMRSIGPCNIQWTDWDECVELEIGDAPFDATTGEFTGEFAHPLAGRIQVAAGWNIVALDLLADGARWELLYAEHSDLE